MTSGIGQALIGYDFSIYAMNGKSVEIDNTDAEGRLVLAGALVFLSVFEPNTAIS